jgi:GATA-binding protein
MSSTTIKVERPAGVTALDASMADGNSRQDLLQHSVFPHYHDDSLDDPREMQRKDPLATQIWKLYSKTKTQLPNQERMENLTWRMMAVSLKKEREQRYVEPGTARCPREMLHRAETLSRLLRQRSSYTSAPSGIAQLRKSVDHSSAPSDPMNLDDFIFPSSVASPAGISSSPEAQPSSMSSNSVSNAIPIKAPKLSQPLNHPDFPPASAPHPPPNKQRNNEFAYVQRHVRKTSIDERRVCVVEIVGDGG